VERVDETAVAKLFEEVKVLFRDLPEQVEGKLKSNLRPGGWRRSRRLHPGMVEELTSGPMFSEIPGGRAVGWLVLISFFRDEMPWLYELGLELYRAKRSGNRRDIILARDQFKVGVRSMRHPMFMDLAGRDEESYMMMRHVPMVLEAFLENLDRPGRPRPGGRKRAAGAEEAPEAPHEL
jgi:hypothetical protein